MAVPKQPRELAPRVPPAEPFAQSTKRQFVDDDIFEQARSGAIWREAMRVIPTAKWAGDLHIAELPTFNVIAVLENPADSKRPHAHTQHATIAIADPGRRLLHFHMLPGRREPLESAGFGVPAKDNFSRRFDPGLRGELDRMRHF